VEQAIAFIWRMSLPIREIPNSVQLRTTAA